MDDLDDLKGRVERATRVLSERDAEEQGRHAKLTALIAALEARCLEARHERQLAEQRRLELEAENEELRSLLVALLDAVEAGSRSRFADAVFALEARVGDLTAQSDSGAQPVAAPVAPAPQANAEETDLDAFTANLAANCAVEEELAEEAEEHRLEAADGAQALLDRIRREVALSDDADPAPSDEVPGEEVDAEDDDSDESSWDEGRRAAS